MKCNRSAELSDRAWQTIAGGVSTDLRKSLPHFPLYYEEGNGSRIIDVDRNEYVDYVMGYGSLILGHSPVCLDEAIKGQIEKGVLFGGQTELEILVGEKIKELAPCAERVRFGCSGSESIHAALQLARAATNRSKVLRFEGHYHGWHDNISWSFTPDLKDSGPRKAPNLVPTSAGQLPEAGANLLSLPWNDLDLVEDLFRKQGDDIAAIITEPIMHCCGAVEPLPGYLGGLRRICDKYGALLIFDEVVTGFRVALGGAQELYGVVPDLAVFGKALGGGMVISCLAGKEAAMNRWGECGAILGGTYNANPLSLTGALATLNELTRDDGEPIRRIHESGGRLIEDFKSATSEANVPAYVGGLPSLFYVSFWKGNPTEIFDYRTFLNLDLGLTKSFCMELQNLGIRVSPPWLVSAAHSDRDIEETVFAFRRAINSMQGKLNHLTRSRKAQSKAGESPNRFGASCPSIPKSCGDRGSYSIPANLRFSSSDLLRRFALLQRKAKFHLFESLLDRIAKPITILDVGGTAGFWESLGFGERDGVRIVLRRDSRPFRSRPHFEISVGPCEDLSDFQDQSVDILFCHSFLETLESEESQEKLATEIRRVGKKHWIQTSCFAFPFDPRSKKWFTHWFTEGARRGSGRGSMASAGRRFFSREELSRFFPESQIWCEKFLGINKSWIVLGGFSQLKTNERGGFEIASELYRQLRARRLFRVYERTRKAALHYRKKHPAPNHYWAVAWEPSEKCNLACTYCYQEHDGRPDEDLEAGINTILSINPRFLWLGGGEPTLLPGLADILKRIKLECNNPWVVVNTNFMSSLQIYHDIAPYVDAIYVSLDGLGEENRLQRGFNGQRLLNRLAAFVPSHLELHWALNTVVTIRNVDGLASFTNIVQQRIPGITQNFWPMCPTNHHESIGKDSSLIGQFHESMVHLQGRYPHIRFSLPPDHRACQETGCHSNPLDRVPKENDLKICHRQFFLVDVGPDGQIRDCFFRQLSALDHMAASAMRRGVPREVHRAIELVERQKDRSTRYNPVCTQPCTFWEDVDRIIHSQSTGDPGLKSMPEFAGRFSRSQRQAATAFIRKNFNPAFEEAFFDHLGAPDDLMKIRFESLPQ